MDKLQVIEAVNKLFVAVDEPSWPLVSSVLDDSVLLDYTSMAGGEPATLTSKQIIDSWKCVLPGFDKTHHQLGNYLVSIDAENIIVFCYGTATHFLKNETNNNVWTVVGTYDLELQAKDSGLKITKLKFNLKYMDGNSDLVRVAGERLK